MSDLDDIKITDEDIAEFTKKYPLNNNVDKSNYKDIIQDIKNLENDLKTVQDNEAQLTAENNTIKNEKVKLLAENAILSAEKAQLAEDKTRLSAEKAQLQNNIPVPYLAIPLVAGLALGGFLGYNLKPKKKKHRDMSDINSELI